MTRRGRNEGGLYQRRDGRWCAVVSDGMANGKRRRRFLYGATKKEAQAKLAEAQRALAEGRPISDERLTVERHLRRWLEQTVKPEVRPRTLESYTYLCERHLIPAIGSIKLHRLQPDDVKGVMAGMMAGGLSAQSAAHARAVLRTSLNQAARWGHVSRNVAQLAGAPRITRRPIRFLTPAQVAELLSKIEGDALQPLVTLAINTGARLGECLALRWSDLSLDGESVTISHSIARVTRDGKRSVELAETKTDKSRRTIRLTPQARAALARQRLLQTSQREFAGDRWTEGGFVFTSAIGTPREQTNVGHDFGRMLRAAGVEHMRFHDLRHCCASLMIAAACDIFTVSRTLGHSQISVTADLYGHLLPQAQSDAADRLGRLLEGASVG